MTIRTLIVDDEPLARRGIRSRLKEVPDIEVVGECENGRRAVEDIRLLSPDLVFLDVQMPGMDGFDVLQAIGPDDMPMVIFVTAYDKHALRAFDVHALDYLLKPIDEDRFFSAVDRVRTQLTQRKESELGQRLSSFLSDLNLVEPASVGKDRMTGKREISERFVVKLAGRIFFVKAREIDWIEAAGDYVGLHVGPKVHLMRQTMSSMEDRLDPSVFVRIHRSTIVNTDRIEELTPHLNGEYNVLMKDGRTLRTSRKYTDRVRSFFGKDL